VLWVDEFLLIS